MVSSFSFLVRRPPRALVSCFSSIQMKQASRKKPSVSSSSSVSRRIQGWTTKTEWPFRFLLRSSSYHHSLWRYHNNNYYHHPDMSSVVSAVVGSRFRHPSTSRSCSTRTTTRTPPSLLVRPRIWIYYATTGGTAQLFATQLADALQEQQQQQFQNDKDDNDHHPPIVVVKSLGDYASLQQLVDEQQQPPQDPQQQAPATVNLSFFLVSTAGVGEPPEPVQAFYQTVLNSGNTSTNHNNQNTQILPLHFAIFGLGNQKAHPNHYNVVGKTLQARLEAWTGSSNDKDETNNDTTNKSGCFLPLALGDDRDCLDDDFDQWQAQVIQYLHSNYYHDCSDHHNDSETQDSTMEPETAPGTIPEPSASSSSSPLSSSSSSVSPLHQVCILYATTGGTAQLFATQLAEAIQQEQWDGTSVLPVRVQSLGDYTSLSQLLVESNHNDKNTLYLFLVSTAGVGEPPEPAQAFYQDLMTLTTTNPEQGRSWLRDHHHTTTTLEFAIFGLGNQTAHPNHYNVVSKTLQERFETLLGGTSCLPLTLGDDGDCIDDDFDQWQELVLDYLKTRLQSPQPSPGLEGTEPAPEEDMPESRLLPPNATATTRTTRTTTTATNETLAPPRSSSPEATTLFPQNHTVPCPGARSGQRMVSSKYPMLQLRLANHHQDHEKTTPPLRYDLLQVIPDWYQKGTKRYRISNRTMLNRNGVGNGLTELEIDLLPDDCGIPAEEEEEATTTTSDSVPCVYEAGDHFVLYPRNADCVVEAYLNYLQVEPHAVVVDDTEEETNDETTTVSTTTITKKKKKPVYPHPYGLTLYETLSFCVDLGATPSPQFVRSMTASVPRTATVTAIDHYKEQVAVPRRTTLDLALELGARLSLEDVLYNLPPLQPRYYSIASSPLNSNSSAGGTKNKKKKPTLLLTYRPIRYLTSRGVLREGICTSYMNHLRPAAGDDGGSTIAGAIRSNPSFRLPRDPQTSVVLIAGGCGVAPVRAFLEERLLLHQQQGVTFGKALVFVGFRDTDDVVYQDLMEECLSAQVITEAHISSTLGRTTPTSSPPGTKNEALPQSEITWSCGNVTESFRTKEAQLWDHFQQGGHTYLCGGARSFGAAVEAKVVRLIQHQGTLSVEQASAYLRQMIA